MTQEKFGEGRPCICVMNHPLRQQEPMLLLGDDGLPPGVGNIFVGLRVGLETEVGSELPDREQQNRQGGYGRKRSMFI